MKTLILVLLLFIIGCNENTTEPAIPTPFNCTGAWSNIPPNLIQFSLFVLQKNDQEFTADVFSNKEFIGTVDNGKIIGEEKYVSFSFKQQTPWGEAAMGFNGRFYLIEDGWELRGILSGRIQLSDGVLGVYNSEQYKFAKEDFVYLFKK